MNWDDQHRTWKHIGTDYNDEDCEVITLCRQVSFVGKSRGRFLDVNIVGWATTAMKSMF